MFIEQLEKDSAYASQVLKTCGIDSKDTGGFDLRVNLLIRNNKVVNVTYAKHYNNLMDGGVGPHASMGSIIWKGSVVDRIFSNALNGLDKIFNKLQDNTFLSFDISISEDKVSVLKFQSYVSLAFMVLYKGNQETLHLDQNINLKDGFAIEITLAVLPFPLSIEYKDTELIGINSRNIKHLIMHHLTFIDKKYRGNGRLCSVTAHGENVRECKRRAYRTIRNLKADGIMYRSDIGAETIRIHNQLKSWGWIDG